MVTEPVKPRDETADLTDDDLTQMTPPHKTVTVENPTLDELREGILPDEYLNLIWVTVTSETIDYSLIHATTKDIGPYILVIGPTGDREQFVGVESIVAREADGKPLRGFDRRSGDVSNQIYLNYEPTQARVADLVEKYQQYFQKVTINSAVFDNLPPSVYESTASPEPLEH